MITKETIEQVAKEWHLSKMNNEKIIPGTNKAFKAGAEYAIQQMNNDAVEFAEWTYFKSWVCYGKNEWMLKDFDSEYGKTLTSQELYQLYLKTKK